MGIFSLLIKKILSFLAVVALIAPAHAEDTVALTQETSLRFFFKEARDYKPKAGEET